MASGGHRNMIQGGQYQNQDIHLTVAHLRARKSQASPNDVYYERQLQSQDRRTHDIPKYSKSLLSSNKYNYMRHSVQKDKEELKRRLQHVPRCEAEAEIQRQRRAEQWRQLIVDEEREERERKRKIEKLQKMIDREMQRAHHRHHSNVNSDNSSIHIPRSHADFKDSGKMSCCSSAANVLSNPEVETDSTEQTSTSSIPTYIDIAQPDDTTTIENVKLAITIEEKDVDLPLRDQMVTNASQEPKIKMQTDQSSVTTTAQIDSPGNITTAETDCPDDIARVEIDSPDDIITAQTDSPDNITTAETDCPDDIATVKRDSPDDITTAERDSPDDITTVDIDSHGVIATVYTDSPENITTVETDSSDDITIAETDNHIETTTAETDNHDDITTATVTTELQIQQTGVAVITQPEANEESDATATVKTTTDVIKTQQRYSTKELQTQDPEVDTTVSMTQPTATQDSESTPQIIIDSDTRPEPYDTKFWYHLSNTDGLKKTPESMSTVFICCHSEYSCEILYLLLYS